LRILPSLVHLLYFHALLTSKKYDLLYISCSRLAASPHLRSHDFALLLEAILNNVVTPKFARFLDRLLNKDPNAPPLSAAQGGVGSSAAPGTGPGGTASLSKLQGAALTLVNMCYNMEYVPERLVEVLPKYLKECTGEIKATFQEQLRADATSTSYSSARADVRAKAEALLQQVNKLRAHSRIAGGAEPHAAPQVDDMHLMLKKLTLE